MDASIIDPIEHPNQHVEAHVDEHDEEDSEDEHEPFHGFERVPQPENPETDDEAGAPARPNDVDASNQEHHLQW